MLITALLVGLPFSAFLTEYSRRKALYAGFTIMSFSSQELIAVVIVEVLVACW
jgi:hypothetical protein